MSAFPTVQVVVARLTQLFGQGSPEGAAGLLWWVRGTASGTGVALRMETRPPPAGEPCVVWVTRPGEYQPERCPIVDLEHLEAFLALVSIARRSPTPVHGNVCPGTN